MPEDVPEDVTDDLGPLLSIAMARIESDGLAALDALCAEHPEQAAALRHHVEQLQAFGMLPLPDDEREDEADFPERLGEFRLLERLGSGGMGVVYLAEQTPIKRKVALKLVRPDQMYFPKARERFRREIDAIARLEHPGIVRVYAVGEERGIPYFAMEWIDGVSLDDLLKEVRSARPEELTGRDLQDALRRLTKKQDSADVAPPTSWSSACLVIVRQVAEALHYAHELGILHRDVKPGNIMITPSGRVVLLDFGLAASIADTDGTAGNARITQTGSQLGSFAYMAPEQHRGQRSAISPRTDVYSLGVVLYELLTHRLPFEAGEGGDVESLRAQVLSGKVEPPRRRNSRIEWDVETICLKAMELEPARRYGSALAFARDLDNALALRPIEAKRASPIARLRREIRRRPARAAAVALAALVLVGLPTIWALFAVRDADRERAASQRIGAALDVAKDEGARATRQQELAERNLKRAVRAVDQMLTRVASILQDEPRTEQLRRELLHEAIGLLESLRRDYARHVGVLSATAGAWLKVAELQRALGEYDAALVALRETDTALATAESMAPENEKLRNQRLELSFGLAEELLERGRLADVEQLVEDARKLVGEHASGESSSAGITDRFAALLAQSSFAWTHAGDGARAQAAAQEAVDMLEAIPLEEREKAQVHLGEAWFALGDARMHAEEFEGARDALGEARACFEERLAAGGAGRLQALHNLSMTLGNLGQLLQRSDELEMAEETLAEAVVHAQKLSDATPSSLAVRAVLHGLESDRGVVLEKLGRLEDAERELRSGLLGTRALAEAHPDVRTVGRDHASQALRVGNLLYMQDRLEECLPFYEEAERARRRLAEQFPDEAETRLDLCADQHELAFVLAALDRNEEALALYRSSFERLCDLLSSEPRARATERLKKLVAEYVPLLERLGRADEAAAVRARADERLASVE